jgi:hypothetical protein
MRGYFPIETEHQTVRDTTTGRPKPRARAAQQWLIPSEPSRIESRSSNGPELSC